MQILGVIDRIIKQITDNSNICKEGTPLKWLLRDWDINPARRLDIDYTNSITTFKSSLKYENAKQ